MERTRWQTLLTLTLVVAGVTFIGGSWWVRQGGQPLLVSPAVAFVLLGFAALLLALGRSVRRWVLGKRPPMDPLHAFRILVLAKASALAGALQLGFFGGQALVALDGSDSPVARAQALVDLGVAGACLVLIGVALLVEWFCRIPPVDMEGEGEGDIEGRGGAAA